MEGMRDREYQEAVIQVKLQENIDAATLMNSLQLIDMAEYPGCGVTYLEMPVSQTDTDVALFEYILSAFVHCGGSALDFNVVDKDKLIKAKRES